MNEKDFEQLQSDALEKDKILHRTTSGIHRDDLQFYIDRHPVKQFASQGQLKSFVLALKLAQFDFLRKEKKETPILLLDDIFDKLDADRVAQLIRLLTENTFGQVCITDAHQYRLKEVLNDESPQINTYLVESGKIKDS